MLNRLTLPPGYGVVIYAGVLPDVLPFGIKRDTEIEDPVYVIVTRDGTLVLNVVVPRSDFDTIDEFLSPMLGRGDGPPGPKLVR
jgi:hypothetical protein